MASDHDQPAEAEDEPQRDDSPADSAQPQMPIHSVSYSNMPMHMYPFAPGLMSTAPQIRSKRRQVKNACTNCQKACKKCDDARPCLRCVKYGIGEECIDSQRKERKKGIKRGPYKKRDGKNSNVEQSLDNTVPTGIGVPPSIPPVGVPPIPFMGQMAYPTAYYSQYAASISKPGEAPAYYPQFYLAPVPPSHHQTPTHEGDSVSYGQPQPHYYPPTFLAPYAQPYHTTYMMPPAHRSDPQLSVQNSSYGSYPPIYSKASGAHYSSDTVDSMAQVEGRKNGQLVQEENEPSFIDKSI